MKEDFKAFLFDINISEEEYNNAEISDKTKLFEAFQKSKQNSSKFFPRDNLRYLISCFFILV